MSTNDFRDYKNFYRNNLPNGVTFDSTLGKYFFNGKRFNTISAVESYRLYLLKTDFFNSYQAGGAVPQLILDFTQEVYRTP